MRAHAASCHTWSQPYARRFAQGWPQLLGGRPGCCNRLGRAASSAADGEVRRAKVTITDTLGKSKLRLDVYVAKLLGDASSRAKVAASIAGGLVHVNDRQVLKPAANLTPGDRVSFQLLAPPPLEAAPEAIPLDVVYEDDQLAVINKPAGMVVHISAGHHRGTLVNALLHHLGMPPLTLSDASSGVPLLLPEELEHLGRGQASGGGGDRNVGASAGVEHAVGSDEELLEGSDDDDDDDERPLLLLDAAAGEGSVAGLTADAASREGAAASTPSAIRELLEPSTSGMASNDVGAVGLGGVGKEVFDAAAFLRASTGGGTAGGTLRPGIVHRLDKGTTGVMVVAKNEAALRNLSQQFKDRTTSRTYVALTLGCPAATTGRIQTNIGRDPVHRQRMAALPYGGNRGRTAASGYTVLEALRGAALVQWRLDTGRTHQIRVHAKHLGHPLLGDDTYGGGGASAAATLAAGRPSRLPTAQAIVSSLSRPALHAQSLGFSHPVTGERMTFQRPPPPDFAAALEALRLLAAPTQRP